MPNAIFTAPDLTTFTRLDELGMVGLGQHEEPDRAVLVCGSLSRRTSGADAAAAKVLRAGRWSGAWRTSRSGGARGCSRPRSGVPVLGVRAGVGKCGAKTPRPGPIRNPQSGDHFIPSSPKDTARRPCKGFNHVA